MLVKCLTLLLLIHSSLGIASNVTYSVRLNNELNNLNGSWGGNLNIGSAQNLDLQIDFLYERLPASILGNVSTFNLISLQVFDLTNNLFSDVISGFGNTSVTYDGVNDSFTSEINGFPGGSLGLFFIFDEFGEVGDELPYGDDFDALINALGIFSLTARAPDSSSDNIGGVNGIGPLSAGDYQFSSALTSVVPIPPAFTLMLAGIAGLWFAGRNKIQQS